MSRHRALVVAVSLVALAVVVGRAAPVKACSIALPDLRFLVTEAPAGGVWWVDGALFEGQEIRLVDESGVERPAETISRGARSFALRVPADAPVGSVWSLAGLDETSVFADEPRGDLVVVEGEPPAPEVPVLGESSFDFVMLAANTDFAFGVPNPLAMLGGDSCGSSTGVLFGLAETTYEPVAAVAVPVDAEGDIVFDRWQTPAGETLVIGTSSQLSDAERPEGDARTALRFFARPTRVEGQLDLSPIDVHVRARSVSSGLASDVVTVPIDFPSAETRLEPYCGCRSSGGGADASALLAGAVLLGLVGVARRRRR